MVGIFGLDISGSGWGPVACCCEHVNEPSGSLKDGYSLTSWATVSFLRRTLLHGVSLLHTNFDSPQYMPQAC